jgi:hypothetical protein
MRAWSSIVRWFVPVAAGSGRYVGGATGGSCIAATDVVRQPAGTWRVARGSGIGTARRAGWITEITSRLIEFVSVLTA